MLQAIRDRAQGIFAWVMLLAVGVPFALWGIQNYIETGKENPAATVGDREIFDREVTRAYEQTLNSLVGIEDFDEKNLRKQALESLVNDEVIAQSAEARSLVVTDNEAREVIKTLPYFQTDGKFDKDKYKVMLSSQGLSPEQFVAQVRRGLLAEQLQRGVTESAFVTTTEADLFQRLKDQERDLAYAKIAPVPATRTYTDAEVEAYYREHVQEFKNPEKVSIQYISLSLEDLAKDVQISDEDLHKLYDEQKASFQTPERRKVSHILIPLQGGDQTADKAARDKAMATRERIVSQGEDFAAVAKDVSGDPVSAKKGGDLGFLVKEAQEPSFTQAAEALAAGQISDPVKTSFGYHLIKVTELVPSKLKPFDEVKQELRNTTQRNRAETTFYERGQKLAEQTFEHPDSLEAAAQQLGLKIQETGLFTREAGEGLAIDETIRKTAFSEDVLNGRNSEPVELENQKAIVLRLKEHHASSEKPLAEVREGIIAHLRDEAARADAAKRGQELVQAVRGGKTLKEAAQAMGLTVVKTGPIRRDNHELPAELIRSAFTAGRPEAGKIATAQVALQDGSQLVYSLLEIKEGSHVAKDSKEAEAVNQYIARNGAQQEFGAFVGRLRELLNVKITEKN
ncbi:MAG: SurA N-terminal domain-containing protein [Methylococcus sp.]